MSNPLTGVPIIESPFFDELIGHLDTKTKIIARQLRSKGYAVLPFPDNRIHEWADGIIQTLHPRYDWDKYDKEHCGMRIQDAWQDVPSVKEIATHPEVLELLSNLYGRKPIPFQTLNFPVGTQQHYHSDCVHFSSLPERFMCGVWVALEDIDEENGPLEYYPETHLWPIITNEQLNILDVSNNTQEVYHKAWEKLISTKKAQRKIFTAKKGDMLIWCANLLHGGAKQLNPKRTRWSQVTHYYFEDCVYYTPMHSLLSLGQIKTRNIRPIIKDVVKEETKPAETKMNILTIGLPVFDDYDGAFFTIQSLRMYHGYDFKIIVVDTQPQSQQILRDLCVSAKAEYFHDPKGTGPAYGKQKIFERSTTEWTMCIDCHILLAEGCIKILHKFLLDNWNSKNLYQGPLIYDDLVNVSTHFDPVWSGQMFGTWGFDRDAYMSDKPFEIPMQGCGLLLMKTKKWPGFNPNFKGFGGEEGYIQEKVRINGGKALCLPFLKWLHRFNRPKGIPYVVRIEDRIYNYFVGRLELGLPYDDVIGHFKNHTSMEVIDKCLQQAQRVQATSSVLRAFPPFLSPRDKA